MKSLFQSCLVISNGMALQLVLIVNGFDNYNGKEATLLSDEDKLIICITSVRFILRQLRRRSIHLLFIYFAQLLKNWRSTCLILIDIKTTGTAPYKRIVPAHARSSHEPSRTLQKIWKS